ncbi:MAG: recombinase zinc beta ribbon domain-containing protein, partial [Saprospiraceae bacterium]|nr:recombinase zinc beta ribbon domain-containing protein [Saprospiraceae bacterium]
GPRRDFGGLLSNLNVMYCGYCGSTWRGWKGQTRTDGTWTNYYGCQGKAHKGKCPKSKMVEQSIIDSRVIINLLGILDRIPELKTAWEKMAATDTSTNRLQQITREQNQLETKKQRLTIAISEGVLEFADARQQMNAIKTTQETLKKEKAGIITTPTEEPPWEELAAVRGIFRDMAQEEQREIIATAIKQIKTYGTYLMIEYRFPISENAHSGTRIHLPSTNHNNAK